MAHNGNSILCVLTVLHSWSPAWHLLQLGRIFQVLLLSPGFYWGFARELLHLGQGGWDGFILQFSIESSVVKDHPEDLGIPWLSLPCASAKLLLLHSGRGGQTQKSMSHIPGQGKNNFLFAIQDQIYKTVFFL